MAMKPKDVKKGPPPRPIPPAKGNPGPGKPLKRK
jgi:hypothetical protein